MAGILFSGALYAGKLSYHAVQRRRYRKKAERAGEAAGDDNESEDDELPPPAYDVALASNVSSPTAKLSARTLLTFDGPNATVPPGSRIDTVRTSAVGGRLKISKNCHIGRIVAAGEVILGQNCTVDRIQAGSTVTLYKGCRIESLKCAGDARVATDCAIESARVAGRIIVERGPAAATPARWL